MRDFDLLITNRVEGSHFLSVKRVTGIIADEALRASQLLVVHCIHTLNTGLFGRNNRAEEGESDLGAGRNVEHALADCALLELLLSDALHELKNARLGTLDTQQLRKLLVLVIRDDVCVELAHIKFWGSKRLRRRFLLFKCAI